ncbi:MAG: 4-alpha-glucanotransferase [Bacteroides sp.]|nr:4-alpha-glucanotransferase [Prevotella sp.]MCM1408851.1 4-alpha-glucanotransferase [Treponema brennaborense]MCM1470789.1 4-alpha-glucanotransferase [Bacteroides sp.]
MTTRGCFSDLQPMTGIALPLGALRTEHTLGVGTYTDLIPFIEFCRQTGLKIIQLLPVNDTGTESSPYSALSAFALHPLYADLLSLPEAAKFPDIAEKIRVFFEKYKDCKRFPYDELCRAKLAFLRELYDADWETVCGSDELKKWTADNPWIEIYAVFMELKRLNNGASWKEWQLRQRLPRSEISARWNDASLRKNHLFFAWMQMRLDRQFSEAADFARRQNIILKGDIPIMMNEDSCDVWAHPEFFDDRLRAGSPPDNENPDGQNWGFPIYRWDNLRQDNYSWWKNRLIHAAKYYDACRIDHVLGFFRIWAVPQTEKTAVLGYPVPNAPISLRELTDAGFSPERIKWLSLPHVKTAAVQSDDNDCAAAHRVLNVVMNRIGSEELWLFKPEITGEKDIYAAQIPSAEKERLVRCWQNRTLIEISGGHFMPALKYSDSDAWKSLSEDEKQRLFDLIKKKQAAMNEIWEKQSREVLRELTGCTQMLACAEDLGAMPAAASRVLEDLHIFGLRVVRWHRYWNKDNSPFVPPEEYPALCVTSSSVHDSSTLRQWWLGDKSACDMAADLNLPEALVPGIFNPDTAQALLRLFAKSAGMIYINPLQDFLHLSAAYYDDNPEAERINIPGTVSLFNWTYRMPVSVEKLSDDTDLKNKIADVVKIHEKR